MNASTRNQPDHLVGLDLGQTADPTAAVVLERHYEPAAVPHAPPEAHYLLNYLKRWPLRTPYPTIVTDMADLVKRPPLCKPALIADQTGVGAAVMDMLRAAKPTATLKPILITSGHAVTLDNGIWHVPKKELVSVLQATLQTGRLKFADVPDRELLVKELLVFKVKITTAGNETFEAWRERDFDDLVLATALAVWWGERYPRVTVTSPPFTRPVADGMGGYAGAGRSPGTMPPGMGRDARTGQAIRPWWVGGDGDRERGA